MAELDPETMTKLSTTSTATLTTQLYRRGFRNAFLQGPRPLGRYGINMIGPAFTLRYVPAREDLDSYGTPGATPTPCSVKPLRRSPLATCW